MSRDAMKGVCDSVKAEFKCSLRKRVQATHEACAWRYAKGPVLVSWYSVPLAPSRLVGYKRPSRLYSSARKSSDSPLPCIH